MRLLPSTRSQLLAWTLLILAIVCAWFALHGMLLALRGERWGAIAALFFLMLGLGLWLRLHIARLLALGLLWLIVVVVPIGVINPFAAMGNQGPNLAPMGDLVLRIAPWLIVSLFVIYVLGKHKREFRWWRDRTR